jgi:hypothetical protein
MFSSGRTPTSTAHASAMAASWPPALPCSPDASREAGSEVRIHGVVHVNTTLLPGTTVPIGWVAVGDPAQIYPPGQHEQIWAIQQSLDFPGTVYGVTPDTPAAERMSRQANWFASHFRDRPIDESHQGHGD